MASRSSLNGLFWSVERLRDSTGNSEARLLRVCMALVFKSLTYLYLLREFQESLKVTLLLVLLFVSFPALRNPDVFFIMFVFLRLYLIDEPLFNLLL